MKLLLLLASFLCLNVFAHSDHSQPQKIPGGPLLGGYPWGVFSTEVDFENRVKHKLNDQELSLANKIFENVGPDLQVAFPIKLYNEGYKPFGDGQSNGSADFASWSELDPPYLAVLNTVSQIIQITFHKSINTDGSLSILYPNGETKNILGKDNNTFSEQVNLKELGWDSLDKGKVIYIKPLSWKDWFPLKFQSSYVENNLLSQAIPENLVLNRNKILNPLNAIAINPHPPLIQLINSYNENNYLMFTIDKVHSIYPFPGDPNAVEKTSGGNWTFLLDPKIWEQSPQKTFKQLYSCFQGRAFWEESMKKTVSGTSWHHVGDEGEIILNSVENETRSLVTAIGEKLEHNLPIAYGLSDVGYAGTLEPGHAFISIKGKYHWHPIHTTTPICVEVWTPLCIPSIESGYGFNCKM